MGHYPSFFSGLEEYKKLKKTKVSKKRGLRKYLYRKENPPTHNKGQKRTHNQKEGEEDVEKKVETEDD